MVIGKVEVCGWGGLHVLGGGTYMHVCVCVRMYTYSTYIHVYMSHRHVSLGEVVDVLVRFAEDRSKSAGLRLALLAIIRKVGSAHAHIHTRIHTHTHLLPHSP